MDAMVSWAAIVGRSRTLYWKLHRRYRATWETRAEANTLRARCEAAIRELEIPVPFDERAFCAALAVRRSRPIELFPLSLRGLTDREVLYGILIDKFSCDVIVYEHNTSRLHQQQIILHEASHLILGHLHAPIPANTPTTLPTSVVGDGTIRHILWRRNHAEAAEQEAELLASLILERAAIGAAVDAPRDDTSTIGALERLASFYRLRKGA